ncbi:VOC family protein [Paenibacillus sp. PL91]|uniref:VOC family protein n=1 Tax=Paenibacillus sp. PL91 TaxID=2729538 RepID=UPI00145C3DB9|nr:VOC family protein [Paenibacillus sp. PL91]MBC9199154.1 VOC family protein [Paenibacillus sp. PL91]
MAKVSRLEHITLYAHDVRRLAAFYETALELKEAKTPGEDGTAKLGIDPSSGRRELIIMNNPHHMHLAFCADTLNDFKAVWHKLKDLGVFTQGPYWQQEGPTFSFFDPEGNHVQIIWTVQAELPAGRTVTFEQLEEWADRT